MVSFTTLAYIGVIEIRNYVDEEKNSINKEEMEKMEASIKNVERNLKNVERKKRNMEMEITKKVHERNDLQMKIENLSMMINIIDHLEEKEKKIENEKKKK